MANTTKLTIMAFIAAVIAAGYAHSATMRRQRIEMTLNSMRAAIDSAETVRGMVSNMHAHHGFNSGPLRDEAAASGDVRRSAYYDSVPIVAAWKSLGRAAGRQGFRFRVAKRGARNSKNEPTAAEAAILDYLERAGHDEYVKVDEAANSVVYAHPIRLTADCLSCHGDPATSATHDGKDEVGFDMEGWKTGEIHGAFILSASVNRTTGMQTATPEWNSPGAQKR